MVWARFSLAGQERKGARLQVTADGLLLHEVFLIIY